jgi:hypothetical protein
MTKEMEKAETLPVDPPSAFRLWFGLLGPPIVWAIQLQTVYLASEWACYTMDHTWIHATSIIALMISVLAFWIAYTEWNSAGGETEDKSLEPDSRRRFMAILGMLSGALFTLTIFATWLPTLTGVLCGK